LSALALRAPPHPARRHTRTTTTPPPPPPATPPPQRRRRHAAAALHRRLSCGYCRGGGAGISGDTTHSA